MSNKSVWAPNSGSDQRGGDVTGTKQGTDKYALDVEAQARLKGQNDEGTDEFVKVTGGRVNVQGSPANFELATSYLSQIAEELEQIKLILREMADIEGDI